MIDAVGKKDSKETNLEITKIMSYIQTIFLLDIWFFTLIMMDDYQKPLTIFYLYLVMDGIAYFCLFLTNKGETFFNIWLCTMALNFFTQFIWGIIVWRSDKEFGEYSATKPNEHFLSYWYTIFYFWNQIGILLDFIGASVNEDEQKETNKKMKEIRQSHLNETHAEEGIKPFVDAVTNGDEKVLNTLDDSIYSLTFVSLITQVCARYDLGFHITEYFFKSTMIFGIQLLMIIFIVKAAMNGKDGLDYVQPSLDNMIMRLTACYLFHLGNYPDVADAFRRLKYLRNNPTNFENKNILPAFVITQYQFWAAFLAEAANLIFLCRQAELTDIIMNYLAFAGVSEIDNIFVGAVRYMKAKDELVENVQDGEGDIIEGFLTYKKDRLKDESERSTWATPKPEEKKGEVRFIIVMFEIERVIYKALYFYLFPYIVVFLSYTLYQPDKSSS